MVEVLDEQAPAFAILSHTWEENEVSFAEYNNQSPETRAKQGYHKIVETCRIALGQGYEYAWIDTCCIDKSSSAELSEAINSMFNW